MLDANLSAALRQHLTNLKFPIELVATVDAGPKSTELRELLTEIAGMSDLVSARFDGDDARSPSFRIERTGTPPDEPRIGVAFAGIPMGHEFTSLVLALLHVGGHPPKVADDVAEQIRNLPGTYEFVTYMSLSCQNCPDVVQALNVMSVLNPNIRHTAVDGALFQDEVEANKVMAVPTVLRRDGDAVEMFHSGRTSVEELLTKLDTGAGARAAAEIDAKDAFDVLVVGGGPAGAAAAIYTARKGVSTGVVAERFGGQVLDTMSIENFISVPHTEGPKFAAALEQHVREYDVDIMNVQRAKRLVPATEPGGLVTVELDSGATLQARSVILSTGARWRHMNVPGETEYLNKGVAFCPHCDGPLFKGKRIAVIGGGNSGVEAAIDLAGIVEHVTLIEFDTQMRADEVLQRKLLSLPNVDVVLNALTTEVLGDGTQVTGLIYRDRDDQELHTVALAGIFVQIGLLPNTEWLTDTVTLSNRGEVVIDDRGATSVPGVFAAGDCTTVPYKQIVIAMGAGSTAALSAFDHLIRTSAPEPVLV
ncbi:MAG TPA: alkyl hydroperoxide reductase subunit F [Ilumatobacter sp.]|nr:alkyl hydroperoxide reductase subunit F [Ilumatobacter sp.]